MELELQSQPQPVPTTEINRIAVITITNPNSLNNLLINHTPDYFILQSSYYTTQRRNRKIVKIFD